MKTTIVFRLFRAVGLGFRVMGAWQVLVLCIMGMAGLIMWPKRVDKGCKPTYIPCP